MKNKVALSVLGKDKPGIVAGVTKVLYETHCNIEDSSMAQLKSEFAMILLIELPKALSLSTLQKKLSATLDILNLSFFIRPLKPSEIKADKPSGDPYIISVFGADKPGIVYTISAYLAKNNINITDVQTNIAKKTYRMLLEVTIPAKVSIREIQGDLDQIAASLSISISLNPVDIPEL